VAVTHVDPGKVELGERLLSEYPPAPDSPDGLMQVVRTGRSQLLEDVRDQTLVANARSPEHLALLRAMGMRSTMIVPMISRGRMIGTITLVSAESGRRFGDQDVLLAEDLGRRAAVAVDNARLYSERAQIARTLQDSLLPERLPTIPGVEVAARYVAAGEGIEVGGDFYDLFEVGEGDWSVVMGDVCGKGADAASLTAMARHTIRSLARHYDEAGAVLDAANEAMADQLPEGRFCTVATAVVEPGVDTVTVTVAIAGHPVPLVLRRTGEVTILGRTGMLLGVFEKLGLVEEEVVLERGDALVLFTDGCVGEGRDSLQVLTSCLTAVAGQSAAVIAEAVEANAVEIEGGHRDDMAILVLRAQPRQLTLQTSGALRDERRLAPAADEDRRTHGEGGEAEEEQG
jgi:hypothetical protein